MTTSKGSGKRLQPSTSESLEPDVSSAFVGSASLILLLFDTLEHLLLHLPK
jgi:hypothetical protein